MLYLFVIVETTYPLNFHMHKLKMHSPARISIAKKIIADYVSRTKPKQVLLLCSPEEIEKACRDIIREA